MPSHRVHFENATGIRLAGIVEDPVNHPVGFALFAHCFTCTKDLKAIVRISRGLAKQGIGVLRFDYTGLGNSQGDFSISNFESNLADIQSASQWLSNEYRPPEILIGHSLGGAAMMASANTIPSAQALVTIGAPSCTAHLAEFLGNSNPSIEAEEVGDVTIGGRTHKIRQQLLDNLRSFDLKSSIQQIRIPHLIIHSLADETLAYRHAEDIFAWTGGAKSMVTLVDSDHLLVNQPDDVDYVSNLIASWSSRFVRRDDEN